MKSNKLNNLLKKINFGIKNLNDSKVFKEIINDSLIAFNLTELMLSKELKTSRTTIKRWRTAETVPHILIREGIYKILKKKLLRMKNKHQSGELTNKEVIKIVENALKNIKNLPHIKLKKNK